MLSECKIPLGTQIVSTLLSRRWKRVVAAAVVVVFCPEMIEFDTETKEFEFYIDFEEPEAPPFHLKYLETFYLDKNEEFPFSIQLLDDTGYRFIVLPPTKPDFEFDLNVTFELIAKYTDTTTNLSYRDTEISTEFFASSRDKEPRPYGVFPDFFVFMCDDDALDGLIKLRYKINSIQLVPNTRKKFEQMYLTELASSAAVNFYTDFTVCVQGNLFRASKFVLAAHSEVFEAMIYSGMKEARYSTVVITDFTPQVVAAMLDCLHSGGKVFPKEDDVLEDLFFLADKYNIGCITERCINELIDSISDETFAARAVFAFGIYDDIMIEQVVNFATKYEWNEERVAKLFNSMKYAALVEVFPEVAENIRQAFRRRHAEHKQKEAAREEADKAERLMIEKLQFKFSRPDAL